MILTRPLVVVRCLKHLTKKFEINTSKIVRFKGKKPKNFWVRCLKHLTTTRGRVSIILVLISLNIHFKGIHAVGNLFSLTFYEKRG